MFSKHMVIRKTLIVALSCIVLTLGSAEVSSEGDVVPNTLDFYQHKIELLNEKYGTDLTLATFSMTESEINDLMIYYSGMTDEEFEEYFYEIVEIARANPAPVSEKYVTFDELDESEQLRWSEVCRRKDARELGDDVTYPVDQAQQVDRLPFIHRLSARRSVITTVIQMKTI